MDELSQLNNEDLLNHFKSNIKSKKKFNIEKNEEEVCLECNSLDVVHIDGFITCKSCGNQMTSIIDNSQEWRYYGQFDNRSNDPSRCGMPVNELMPNASMGSVIGNFSNDTSDFFSI